MSQDIVRDKTQQYAKRTFKRVLLPLVFVFLFLNVLVYSILNIPAIQRKIVSYVNKEILNPYSYELALESLDVDLVPTQLVLNKIRLSHLVKEWNPGLATTTQKVDQSIDVAQVKLGVHLIESYVKSRLILSDLEVDGFELKSTLDDSDKPIDVEEIVKNSLYKNGRTAFENIRLFLPDRVKIKNVSIELLNSIGQWKHRIGIEEIAIRKPREFSPKSVSLNINLKSYDFFIEAQNELNTGLVTIEAVLQKTDVLDVKKIEIKGPLAHIVSSGQFMMKKSFLKSGYKFKIDADVQAASALKLAGMKGSGAVKFQGEVRTTGKLDATPVAFGTANWEKLKIDDFDIYTGSAKIDFENMKVRGDEFTIKTYRGADVKGKVLFHLSGAFPFSGQLDTKNWPLTELLNGLDVKTDVFDFNVNTSLLDISGEIFRKKDNQFTIQVRSDDIEALEMRIPQKEFADDRPRLPDCALSLELFSDEQHLDLSGTNLSCGVNDSIVASKGIIQYDSGEAEFLLHGENVEMSILDYFLKRPTQGVAKLDGVLRILPNQPLTFSAKVDARDVLLFGFPLKTMKGHVVLDPEKISGEKLTALIKDKDELAVKLDKFSVRFADLHGRFDGSASGSLSTRILSVAGVTDALTPTLDGKIGTLEFSIDGPILHPQNWSFLGKMDLLQPRFVNLSGSRLRLDLNCKVGNCENSRLQLDAARAINQVGETRSGSIVVDLKRITNDDVNLRAQLSFIPLQGFVTGDNLSGVADLRLDMVGKWESWTGDATGRVDGLKIGSVDLGPVLLNGRARPKQGLQIDLSAKYNQIVVRGQFANSLRGPSKLNLRINDYDAFAETKSNVRQQFGLISRMSADFDFSGPGPFSESLDGKSIVDLWTMNGSIKRIDVDAQQITYRLAAAAKASLKNGVLQLQTARLVSGNDKMQLNALYDISRNLLNANVSLNSSLALLEAVSPRITSAQGRMLADLKVNGPAQAPSVKGFIKLSGKRIMLKDFAPEFSDIEGEVEFSENRAEIRRIRARKGGGQIDAVGSVDWSQINQQKAEYPVVSIRVNADRIQSRLPQSVFGSFDLTSTANLQISGNDLPYLIKGDVSIHRAVAVREAVCQELFSDLTNKKNVDRINTKKPALEFDLSISAVKTINIQNQCFRVNASSDVKLNGTSEAPILVGNAKIESGNANFLGRRYAFRRADFAFDNPVRIDPRIDVQTVAEVQSYKIYINITGTAFQFKTDMWSEPSALPSGETLTRQDIASMLSTGQVPTRTGSNQGGYILANNAADALSTQFDDPLSQAFSKITGGLIDTVQVRPQLQDGENKLILRTTKSIGERLSLGVDVDLAPSSTKRSQSLRGNYFLNDTVNLQGGIERTTTETQQTFELLGGLRFQFGRE